MRSPKRMWCKITVGERLQMEPDPAHPAGHQIAAELDLLAGIDRLLAIERQAVRVFGDGDMGEERLGRNPSLDQMWRRRRLHHAAHDRWHRHSAACASR